MGFKTNKKELVFSPFWGHQSQRRSVDQKARFTVFRFFPLLFSLLKYSSRNWNWIKESSINKTNLDTPRLNSKISNQLLLKANLGMHNLFLTLSKLHNLNWKFKSPYLHRLCNLKPSINCYGHLSIKTYIGTKPKRWTSIQFSWGTLGHYCYGNLGC